MTEPVKILVEVPQHPYHPTYAVEYWVVVRMPTSRKVCETPGGYPVPITHTRHGPFRWGEIVEFIRERHVPGNHYEVEEVLRYLR